MDINAVGQVAGGFSASGGGIRAFITSSNGVGMTDLGALGGNYSYAFGINAAGRVVGDFEVTHTRAFITGLNGEGIAELDALSDGFSTATGINDAGQVVGASFTSERAEGMHAFITGPNGMGITDLNSWVNLPDGEVLYKATAINNGGQVVAISSVSPIPEPASYALMLAGLGLVSLVAGRKKLEK
ncbi:PEP-CTERM sorting domain-containing protein [Nitrosospira sp. Nl5]|uniref:PEP-CTERM sorting domain-containing protein n=1 Tax=Nitrosospira sp. Nl5 TaxID=200120 RepID=UPI000AA0E3E5|nr:PEP-CTERM sorting domain-containing protein [Nitrosospira sp. Nl5]